MVAQFRNVGQMSHVTVIVTAVVVLAAASVSIYASIKRRTTLMNAASAVWLTALAIEDFTIGRYGWLPYFLAAVAALAWVVTLVRALRSRSKIAQ